MQATVVSPASWPRQLPGIGGRTRSSRSRRIGSPTRWPVSTGEPAVARGSWAALLLNAKAVRFGGSFTTFPGISHPSLCALSWPDDVRIIGRGRFSAFLAAEGRRVSAYVNQRAQWLTLSCRRSAPPVLQLPNSDAIYACDTHERP